jgi:hypothetical protein
VARLVETGGIPKPMTPAQFGKLVAGETKNGARWWNSATLRLIDAEFAAAPTRHCGIATHIVRGLLHR